MLFTLVKNRKNSSVVCLRFHRTLKMVEGYGGGTPARYRWQGKWLILAEVFFLNPGLNVESSCTVDVAHQIENSSNAVRMKSDYKQNIIGTLVWVMSFIWETTSSELNALGS